MRQDHIQFGKKSELEEEYEEDNFEEVKDKKPLNM